LAEKLLYGFKNLRRDLAIILSSTSPSSASGLIQGLQERLGNSFPFIGTSSPDKSALQKASVVFDETICAEAACGILLGGKLRFSLGVGQGWKPLGKIHRITKSHGNVAFEIDDKPAAKMYEEYFGRTILALRKDLQDISTLYPLGVYLEGRKEYLLRNIIFIESDGSMVLRGDVPEGSGIRLMIGTKESCLKAAKEAAEQVKRGLTGQPPTFALVFSSASRYTLLGRDIYKELGAIQEEVGPDTPLLGLYTYGEIAPLRAINYLGKTYFHNQSINILAIGS